MFQQYSIEQITGNLNKIIHDIKQGDSIQIMEQGQQIAVILSTAEYKCLFQKKAALARH